MPSLFRSIVAGLLLTALATPPAAATPDGSALVAPVAPPAPAPVPSRPALWKVADADTTIWLFGTIHIMPRGGEPWLAGPVAQALNGSDTLVTEILPTDMIAAGATKPGLLPPGQSLFAMIGPERSARLRAVLAKTRIPPAMIDGTKPWFAAAALAVVPLFERGYSPSEGVERALAAAHPQGQQALETAEFQFDLMDGLPRDAQIAWLDSVVDQYDTIGPQIGQIISAWRKGDAEALGRLMTADMKDDPRLVETLLTRRNATWAKWIEARLKQPGTVFVAVGAGHLAGKGSVQDDLAQHGITVTRVQ